VGAFSRICPRRAWWIGDRLMRGLPYLPLPRFWRRLRTGLSRRPDSEHVQILVRLVIVGLVIVYFASLRQLMPDEAPAITTTLPLLAVSMAISIALLVWLLIAPAIHVSRRVVAALHDNAMLTLCLILCGEIAAPCYGLYLWVTLGYGFRYGEPYLKLSQGLSIAGFLLVWALSPFWRDNALLSGSLLATLIVVPSYAAALIRMIHAAKARAEEHSRAKSDFVALVSHEFRTPLNGIVGHAQLLETTSLTDEQAQYLRNLRASAAGLLDLVESVLDISRIESGEYTIELADVGLRDLVLNCLATVDVQARHRGLRLLAHVDPRLPRRLMLDVKSVREVLLNLLGNAIKFTESGTVELTVVGRGEPDDDHFRLICTVRDSGIGIARRDFDRVFARFTQVRGGARRPASGAGLGTTIARELARRMGGDIWLESVVDAGTAFHLELPVTGHLLALPYPAGGRRVVLVGEAGRESPELATHLRDLGAEVLPAADVQAMLAGVRSTSLPVWVIVPAAAGVDFARDLASALVEAAPELVTAGRLLALIRVSALSGELAAAGYAAAVPVQASRAVLAALLAEPLTPASERGLPEEGETITLLEQARALLQPMRLMRVLMVDDNSVNRLMMSTWLEKLGIEHQVAASGHEFLDMAADGTFDLFLVDHQMPDLDGIEALNLYRTASTDPQVPALLVSADVQPETVARALRAGFAAVIAKPLRLENLVNAMARAFRPVNEAGEVVSVPPSDAVSRMPTDRALFEAPDEALVDAAQLLDATALAPDEAAAFAQRLIGAYEADARTVFAGMRASMAVEDWPSLWDAAHALKGNSANVGAIVASACCAQIEAMTPEELRIEGAQRLDQLEAIVARSVARLVLRPVPPRAG
jgi:two-component system sensor histidine kinase RpfC